MKMKDFLQNTWKHRAHVVMALPAFLILLFFSYIPMAGLVMAFKSFDYSKGIWTSPWNGIENFKFLLASKSTFKRTDGSICTIITMSNPPKETVGTSC